MVTIIEKSSFSGLFFGTFEGSAILYCRENWYFKNVANYVKTICPKEHKRQEEIFSFWGVLPVYPALERFWPTHGHMWQALYTISKYAV